MTQEIRLQDGQLPIANKPADVRAYVIGEEGENILSISRPSRVIVPMFIRSFSDRSAADYLEALRQTHLEEEGEVPSAEFIFYSHDEALWGFLVGTGLTFPDE